MSFSLLLGLLIALCWGIADIQSSRLPHMSTTHVTVIAQGSGMLALTLFGLFVFPHPAWGLVSSTSTVLLPTSTVGLWLGLGGLSALAYFCLYRAFQSAQRVQIGLVSTLIASNSVVTVLLSFFLFHEQNTRQLSLVGVITCGIVFITAGVGTIEPPRGRRTSSLVRKLPSCLLWALGAMLSLGSFNFAIGTVEPTNWFFVLLGTRAFSLLFLSLLLAMHPQLPSPSQSPASWNLFEVLRAASIGVAEVAGLLIFRIAAQVTMQIGLLATIASCSLLLPFLYGYGVKRESVRPLQIIGLVVIFLGLLELSGALPPLMLLILCGGCVVLLWLIRSLWGTVRIHLSFANLIHQLGFLQVYLQPLSLLWFPYRQAFAPRFVTLPCQGTSRLMGYATWQKSTFPIMLSSAISSLLGFGQYHLPFAVQQDEGLVMTSIEAKGMREETEREHDRSDRVHDEQTISDGEQVPSQDREPQTTQPTPISPPVFPDPPLPKRHGAKREGVILALLGIVLVVVLVSLLPILLSTQPAQFARPSQPSAVRMNPVGTISFTGSGQLTPVSSQGINDIVTINLHDLTPPAPGQREYAWLLPDATETSVKPLLCGALPIVAGKTHFTCTSPDHRNLLATFSRFLVTEQADHPSPLFPSDDHATWKYSGSLPDIPTPGDEAGYSLLSHLRHLVAQDPTLASIGLSGGLSIWLHRNTGKILEWSNAARDDWGISGATDLMRREIDRVLDYLDGVTYVWRDVPASTPWLVDPKAGRLGLLDSVPRQNPPGYLTHIMIHLEGLLHAPGATAEQERQAVPIMEALTHVITLMQMIRTDAIQLANMKSAALQQPQALQLLNAMVSMANEAYVGEPDATGHFEGGVTSIYHALQGLALIEIRPVVGGTIA